MQRNTTIHYETDFEAMQKINEIIRAAKETGWDILSIPIGAHVNPGDAYDAYEVTGLKPTAEDVLGNEYASPLGAFIMQQHHPLDEATWRNLLKNTFDPQYIEGFHLGFSQDIPIHMEEYFQNTYFIRGVYDGVMARAAVF